MAIGYPRIWQISLMVYTLTSFSCAATQEDAEPRFIDLLNVHPFEPKPGWIETGRAELYSQEVRRVFHVDDPNRGMRWMQYMDVPVEHREFPELVFRYRARRVLTDDRHPNTYTIWLFDGPNMGSDEGFTVVAPSQLISDGLSHEIRVDLGEFRPRYSIKKLAIQVSSTEEGNAELEIERLEFIGRNGSSSTKRELESLQSKTDEQFVKDFDTLITELSNEDKHVREAAARTLGELGDERATEPLIRNYYGSRVGAFDDALWALGNFDDERVQVVLREALRHTEVSARRAAAILLERQGCKPADREENVRRLIILERWEEVIAAGSSARPVPGQTDTFEGPFEIGIPILVPFERSRHQEHLILPYPWIEFTQVGRGVDAILDISFASGPKASWTMRLDLLDSGGSTLGHVVAQWENSGTINGLAMIVHERIVFQFDSLEELPAARSFRCEMSVKKENG